MIDSKYEVCGTIGVFRDPEYGDIPAYGHIDGVYALRRHRDMNGVPVYVIKNLVFVDEDDLFDIGSEQDRSKLIALAAERRLVSIVIIWFMSMNFQIGSRKMTFCRGSCKFWIRIAMINRLGWVDMCWMKRGMGCDSSVWLRILT